MVGIESGETYMMRGGVFKQKCSHSYPKETAKAYSRRAMADDELRAFR